MLLKNIGQKAVPTKASAEERCDGKQVKVVAGGDHIEKNYR